MRRFLTMSCLLVCIWVTTTAQDSIRTTTLDAVVVSATRSTQPILGVPRSITVIGQDVISKSIYNSVGELLGSQSGMYIVGSGQTPGSNQSVFMRGATSNQVAVLIDGVRITDPSTPNSSLDLAELSLTNVERIEVLRGSHSTMYGGAAVGGVINIITKSGVRPGLHGTVTAQGGTYGDKAYSFNEDLSVSYAFNGGWYTSVAVHQEDVNGLDATPNSPNGPANFSSDRDNFRKTDATAKLGFKKSHWDLSASYKRIGQTSDIDNGANSNDDNNTIEFERNIIAYNLQYKLNNNWRLEVVGSGSNLERVNENDSSKIDNNGNTDQTYLKASYKGKMLTQEIQLSYSREGFNAMLGLGTYFEKMSFNSYFFSDAFGPFESIINYDSLQPDSRTGYAFGRLNRNFTPSFELSIGARLSHHSHFGSFATLEFNPSFHLNNSLIYASISSGFNAPSLYQLYDPTLEFGAYRSRGNKDLQPEKSISLELGFKREFFTESFVTVSLFHRTTKNLIEYVYLWNGDQPVNDLGFSDYRGDTYLNITSQTVYGLELDAHYRLSDQFSLGTTLTVLEGNIQADRDDLNTSVTGGNHVQLYGYGHFLDSDLRANGLVRRPSLMAKAHAEFRATDKITLGVSHRHTGSRLDTNYDPLSGPFGALGTLDVKEYDLIDLNARVQFMKYLTIALRVENVFDEQYQEIAGFNTRGRSAYVKAIVTF